VKAAESSFCDLVECVQVELGWRLRMCVTLNWILEEVLLLRFRKY